MIFLLMCYMSYPLSYPNDQKVQTDVDLLILYFVLNGL